MSRYFTKTLSALEPYTPGEQLAIENLVKLNANENTYPPAPGVAAAVAAAVPGLRLYSDLTNGELNRAIAAHWGVKPENVLCGNGSDENLLLALRALCDEEAPLAFADITYSFYPVLCDLLHIPQHIIPLEADFTLDLGKYKGLHETIVIANPNAPTSLLAPVDAIEEVLRTNPDNIVIVDETYIEFAPAGARSLPLLEKYDNLVITHTFSKTHNLAGARLGFCLARPELIADMNRVAMCLSAGHKTVQNILARKAFTISMADAEHVAACDYVGIVSGNHVPDKVARAGFHTTRSSFVDAPLIDELPLALECRLVSFDPETEMLIGEIVNVAAEERILDAEGKIDPAKLRPITFDTVNHAYLVLGEKVGNAFRDGNALK